MQNRRNFLLTAAAVVAGLAGCSLKLLPGAEDPAPEPAAPPAEEPRPLVRVALLSDPHTVAADSDLAGGINGKLIDATRDLAPFKPDLWVVTGDIANGGLRAELEAFKEIMAAVAAPESLLVTTGNHDFYDAEADDAEELLRFTEAFGLSTPYSSRVQGGLHVVMLATEQYKTAPGPREWAWLTGEQLEWFDRVLAEHPDDLTLVCLHQPLQDTVVWSHGGNDFGGCGQAEELRAILRRNPQVKLWFSGHTHMPAAEPGNLVTQEGVTFVGLGSTFYMFDRSAELPGPDIGGYRRNLSANQSHLLDLWPDRVEVRPRDPVTGTFLDQASVVLGRQARASAS